MRESFFFFFFHFLNEEQFRRIHESRQCTGVLRNFAETFSPCGAASEPQKLTASFLEDDQRGRQLLQGRRPVTILVRRTCVPARKVRRAQQKCFITDLTAKREIMRRADAQVMRKSFWALELNEWSDAFEDAGCQWRLFFHFICSFLHRA